MTQVGLICKQDMGNSVDTGKKKMHLQKSILNYINVHSDDDIILRGFLAIRVIAILTKECLIKEKKMIAQKLITYLWNLEEMKMNQ